MRRALRISHRWLGLLSALFLFNAGASGAVIAWNQELDALLNPELFRGGRTADRLLAPRALALADAIELADARLRVRYLPLTAAGGESLSVFVERRIPGDRLAFDQLFIDSATGQIQGRRRWGELSFARKNLIPFLYNFHSTLALPAWFGEPIGALFMGGIALLWVVDSFIALTLAFPWHRLWRRSFAFRWRSGGNKLVFDLHRSGGVWVWALVLVLAVTAVSMNLEAQVARPFVSLFSPLASDPLDDGHGSSVVVSRARAVELATAAAKTRGVMAPPGDLFFVASANTYGVRFFDREHGRLGDPCVYIAADDGRLLAFERPGQGSAGDRFLQLQFPLHSGRILGVCGRVLVMLLGLGVAMLSATGVLLWARKRRGHQRR